MAGFYVLDTDRIEEDWPKVRVEIEATIDREIEEINRDIAGFRPGSRRRIELEARRRTMRWFKVHVLDKLNAEAQEGSTE